MTSTMTALARPAVAMLFSLVFLAFGRTAAQGLHPQPGEVFDDASIARIDFTLPLDTLIALYSDPASDAYVRAEMTFTRDGVSETIQEIGLRFRGNFSRYANKKNFKVSFNRFRPGRKWNGLEKLNLNGQANDPTISRAKLVSDMPLALGSETTRAGHCEVWINGDYFGLYINVEHIDEQFAENHFGSSVANVYKCTWPGDLIWQGSSASEYSYCELTETGDMPGYDDLVSFVDVLNNTPTADLACALESYLNVDDYLRQAAVEVQAGHWDGYIYNQNNFYMVYNPIAGRFEYVIYDTDNTLGIDWIGRDWGTRDIYEWAQGSGNRPLYERLLEVPELRARFSWYLDRLIQNPWDTTTYFPMLDALEALISPSAEADPFRPLDQGFTVDDFHDAFETALGGHVDYGLKTYVTTRSANTLAQLEGYNVAPVVNHWRHNYPVLGQAPRITAFAEDDNPGLVLWAVYTLDAVTDSVQMLDDGLHEDGAPGDGIYGALLPASSSAADWSYRIHAYGTDGRVTRRPCEPEIWPIDAPFPGLVINEFMASNASSIADEEGQYADWLEVYNAGEDAILLSEYFLSPDPRYPAQWRMPTALLEPGAFAWFWADDDEDDGPNHANFRLSADGGSIGIYAADADRHRPVFERQYGAQTTDVSTGFTPDASGEWQELSAVTPGWSNVVTGIAAPLAKSVRVFPNPASRRVYLSAPDQATWTLSNIQGQILRKWDMAASGWQSIDGLPAGLYSYHVRVGDRVETGKLLVN